MSMHGRFYVLSQLEHIDVSRNPKTTPGWEIDPFSQDNTIDRE